MASRLMEINTPLGEGVLLFNSMHAREELSRLSEYQLDLLSETQDIDLDQILGKSVTVKLSLPNQQTRYFNGYVTRIVQQGMFGRYHRYHAVVRPWLWFLTRTADCRIFQDMTVPQIIQKVFADHPTADFQLELNGSYRQWSYCVQYRESDFNFISRLMEHEGIYYYFKHEDGRNILLITDSYSGHVPFPGYEEMTFVVPNERMRADLESVTSWQIARQIQPGSYVHDDYDLERPSVELLTQKTVSRNHAVANYEIYDYPGTYIQKPDGQQYAMVRLDEFNSQFEIANAKSNARGVGVGYLLKLGSHPRTDQNREYLVLASTYDLHFGGYEGLPGGGGAADVRCTFVAMSSQQQYRPQRTTPKPFVQGPQTAMAVGPSGDEIYTDKYGRAKVQFHWDRYGSRDENSSCWIRVSQPWAGKGWGAVAIPRIGQEVIVDFLEGDPDQPIITGRVYNGDNMPPYTLPAAGVVSGVKTNTVKGKGYNEMSMDDTAGKEKITIHGQYDMNTTVEHDQTNTVNNDSTETIKNNAIIAITQGKYSHDVQTGTATYHVKDALVENYDNTQATTVKQDITIKSTSGAITISSDSKNVLIKAATQISLEVGQSKLTMANDGTISLEGVNITITGSTQLTMKGGVVHSEADSQHQTKGAIVSSEGSATNTIKGGMVMLNP
jgi:type VI secretion system secreted protein VgrG